MDSAKDEIIDKFKVKSDNIIVKKKAIISWYIYIYIYKMRAQ